MLRWLWRLFGGGSYKSRKLCRGHVKITFTWDDDQDAAAVADILRGIEEMKRDGWIEVV